MSDWCPLLKHVRTGYTMDVSKEREAKKHFRSLINPHFRLMEGLRPNTTQRFSCEILPSTFPFRWCPKHLVAGLAWRPHSLGLRPQPDLTAPPPTLWDTLWNDYLSYFHPHHMWRSKCKHHYYCRSTPINIPVCTSVKLFIIKLR